jgi:hypothetical protein
MLMKIGMAALAALTIVGSIAVSTGAEARWRGGGGFYRGGGYGIGAGLATGLALGAYGAYGYGPGYYGYGGGCNRNRVVGHTPYGRPIIRPVNVCY